MNRAARRRGESYWKKLVTRGEMANTLDGYDEIAVKRMREVVDILVSWLTLPMWKRAWLTLRGRNPFREITSLVDAATYIEEEPPPED